MKTYNEIYNKIKNSFKKRTKLDIAEGTALDSFTLAAASGIKDAYDEIENNKTPHIYTSLKGRDLDGFGLLVGCTRKAAETDEDYLYRLVRWNKDNQTSNLTAIENALLGLKYANTCKYIPLTCGVGTGSIYIIPKDLSEETCAKAIQEVKEKIRKVSSAQAYIEYVIPEVLDVNIHAYIKVSRDIENAKVNIRESIKDYINNIKPGEYFKIGEINKIGINTNNVDYFMVSNVIINNEEVFETEIIQKLEEKLIFNSIIWNEVE